MERQPVESSQLKAIGHDPANNRLEIEFKTGAVYQYENVDADLHQRLISAESVGSFFYRTIKPNAEKYPYRKVE